MLQPLSYKDPAGFVLLEESFYYRYINLSYQDNYNHLMNSGLYHELVEKKLLIPHKEVSIPNETSRFYKKILPEQIPFIAYPYEWSFEQWKSAIVTYLKICLIAIKYEMVLRDATPFNLSFHKGGFILLDTLSFGMYEKGMPWIAYRQFCESMLGPLALIRYKDTAWSTMMSSHINGWQLPFISKHLPLVSYFNITCLIHIHWHSHFADKTNAESYKGKRKFLKKEQLAELVQILESDITGWKLEATKKPMWKNYYLNDIESDAYFSKKCATLRNWLQKIAPSIVVDLGSNTGAFSIIASIHAKKVIAVESDSDCIDELFRRIIKENIFNIIPVLSDITQPAPGLGWNNTEKAALLERIECDCLLALAVVHHLRITKNIPMELIAQCFAQITTAYLIVEFVPETDDKVQCMFRNRGEIFADYNENNFIKSFGKYFTLKELIPCNPSKRKLFLWHKN